jgi:hypothetical protein
MGLFGFLGRGKSKPKPEQDAETSKPIKLTVGMIPTWLNSEFSGSVSEIDAKVKSMCTSITNNISDIESAVGILEKAEFEKGNKTYVTVNMVKSLFVKRSHSLLGKRPTIPEKPNFSDFEKFHSDSLSLLNNLKKISPKQAILISNYFKKEANVIFAKIKELEDGLDEMKDFLKNEAKIKQTINDALTVVDEHRQMKKQMSFLESMKKELDLRAKTNQKLRKEKETELSELTKGNDWKNMEDMNRAIDELNIRISDTSSKIEQELSVSIRPLKKLEHLASSGNGIAKEDSEFLGMFVDSPLDALMKNKNENNLKHILKLTDRLVNQKEIILKQKDHEKLLDLIRKLDTQIPWMKENHTKLTNEKNDKKKEIESRYPRLIEQKNELDDIINTAQKEEGKIASEIKETGAEVENTDKNIKTMIKKLETMLSEGTNRRVVLDEI